MSKRIDELTDSERRHLGAILGGVIEAACAALELQCRFALVLLDGPGQAGQYVGNGDRGDAVRAMRSCANMMEAGEDVPLDAPAATVPDPT